MKTINLILISTILMSAVSAQQEESMDTLLDTFLHNSDLSKKTKLENAGNVTIITREELERMQARNLKDVIKTLPMLNYRENRLALPDPGYITQDLPFNSNSIRIYIDDQEVTSATYGSGLFYIGDIDIGFVDHIEVYSLNPSFEHATEPAKYLIKLYSKVADRDRGGKAELSLGSRGYNQESVQYAGSKDDLSYFTYVSRVDDQRKKHQSFDRTLSKDQERYFFFSTISTQDNHLQVQALKNDKDLFTGLGSDARPNIAENKTEYLHVGYENNAIENLKLGVVWERGTSDTHLTNDYEDYRVSVTEDSWTIDAQYKWQNLSNNDLVIGAKYRYKHFYTNELTYNGYEVPKAAYDVQAISSLYMEDHYSFSENWLLTLGGQISQVYNNAQVEDHKLWLARAGVIYSDEQWVAKTFLHRSEFLVEPYLYIQAGYDVESAYEPEKVSNITQEVQYKKDSYSVRTVIGYSQMKNVVRLSGSGNVSNDKDILSQFFTYVDYEYKFSLNHSLASSISYTRNENFDDVDNFERYKANLRFLNRFGDIDLFNEVIYYRDTLSDENYVDYSFGIKYRYSDALTLSLKGENIFDRAYEDYYTRGGYTANGGKWEYYDTLFASPIDQRIYLTVEYLF